MTAPQEDGEDTMKILLATDIHLGYNETHPTRADDSFITFEEILQIGVKKKVDFVLLGGDLFHDGKPSVSCMGRCMELLNRYCLGDGEVKINVLSDPSEIFSHSQNPMVNYTNPNLNIALPIFSIHGNHDDPLGYNAKCSLDMLSAAGLINYFGKYTNLQDSISMVPLLISKGSTKVAIYGLGALKDKMACRLFRTEKVNVLRPPDQDDWFNMMVVHQNRSQHTKDECLQESYLPDLMNLIFWGHEHQCRLKPEFNANKNFYVTQPGSSVATSLSEGESVQKQVGILHVKGTKFSIQPINLKTVRPFVFHVVDLATEYLNRPARNMNQGVQAFLEEEVEKMLEEAAKLITGHPKQPTLPLLRLRVDHCKQDELFNTVRFGLQFEEKVANPSDMLVIKRSQGPRALKTELDNDAFDEAATKLHGVEELIENYFKNCDTSKRMQVIPVVAMNEALAQQMKGDNAAFDIVLRKIKDKTTATMKQKNLYDEGSIIEEFEVMRDAVDEENADDVIKEVQQMLEEPRSKDVDDEAIEIDSDGEPMPQPEPTRGRGRGRATRARGRARGSTSTPPTPRSNGNADESMDDSVASSSAARPARGPGSRGGRGPRGRARAAAPARAAPPPTATRTTARATAGNRISQFLSDSE